MAWIELHQSRQRHPKTLRLTAALNVDRRYACGVLDDFWTWGLDAASPEGRLEHMSAEAITAALDFPAKRSAWVIGALVSSGYLDIEADGTYKIHDWPEYAGRLYEKRRDTKARVERYRERQKAAKTAECNALQSVTQRYSNASTYNGSGSGSNSVLTDNPVLTPLENKATVESTTPREEPNAFTLTAPLPPTIESYIADKLATPINRAMVDDLTDYEAQGLETEAVRYAVDIALNAGSPTWRFTRAVIRDWLAKGVKTLDGAKAAQKQHDAAKAKSAQSRAAPTYNGKEFKYD